MPAPKTPSRRLLRLVEKGPVLSADLTDPDSQRVLTAAARAVAAELGRQAAREFFLKCIGLHKER